MEIKYPRPYSLFMNCGCRKEEPFSLPSGNIGKARNPGNYKVLGTKGFRKFSEISFDIQSADICQGLPDSKTFWNLRTLKKFENSSEKMVFFWNFGYARKITKKHFSLLQRLRSSTFQGQFIVNKTFMWPGFSTVFFLFSVFYPHQ